MTQLLAACALLGAQIPSASPLLAALWIGEPVSNEGLAVYPVFSDEEPGKESSIGLAEAAKAKAVFIFERKPVDTHSVLVRNEADAPLVILAGQLLIGATQDRVVAQDWVVLPGKTAAVPAYCVEKSGDRKGQAFEAGDFLVPEPLRQGLVEKGLGRSTKEIADVQFGLWNRISRRNLEFGQRADGSIRLSIRPEQAIPLGDALFEKLATMENHQKVVGVAYSVIEGVATIDLFGSHLLFVQNAKTILRSLPNARPGLRGILLPNARMQSFLDSLRTLRREPFGRGEGFRAYRSLAPGFIAAEIESDAAVLRGVLGPGFVHGAYYLRL